MPNHHARAPYGSAVMTSRIPVAEQCERNGDNAVAELAQMVIADLHRDRAGALSAAIRDLPISQQKDDAK